MRYKLLAQRTLIVRGPALLALLSGHAQILGQSLKPEEKVVVAEQRQLPIESNNGAELEITLGKLGGLDEIGGSTIPPSWDSAVSALAEMQRGTVIVLGPTDVGKSTLCVYLLNRLGHTEQGVRIIDADIGQTDVGPPTSIALASPTQPVASLTELTPELALFIGHTTPSYVEAKLINGIRRLAAHEGAPLTVINTDGWVAEREAARYKISLISQVQPELVLGLACGDELQAILDTVQSHVMRVSAAENVLSRSRADRKMLRTWGYRRFLSGGETMKIPFSNVRFSAPKHFPAITAVNRSALRNLIIGIIDAAGYLTNIGILLDVEPDGVRIYSKQRDAISQIELGFVKLTPSGREIGFI